MNNPDARRVHEQSGAALSRGSMQRRILFVVTAVVVIGVASLELWWSRGGTGSSSAAANEALVEISWETLVPEGYMPPSNPLENMTQEQIDVLLDGSDASNRELAEMEEVMSFAP